MPLVSGALDFLLGLVCLGIAWGCVRVGNDFLFTGFLWVSSAALVGAFNLAGYSQVAGTHAFLSQVGRGPGTLAMGLGVFAALYGPFVGSRWSAGGLAIFGAAVVHLLSGSAILDLLSLILGSTLLVGLVLLAGRAFRRRRLWPALAATSALLLLLGIGFVVPRLPFPAEGVFRRVDLLHVMLALGYSLLWFGVRDVYERGDG